MSRLKLFKYSDIDPVLDRITNSDDVDEQVEREIWRYWNDQVQSRSDKYRVREARRAVTSYLANKRQ